LGEALYLLARGVMINADTLERNQQIVELLEKKKVTPKEVRAILFRRGIFVSLWAIYKIRQRCPKMSKKILIQIWR
jgi:hypothetical protein